jgi:hypothetical protein
MNFWPVIIVILILGVAVALFYVLPAVIDYEMSFLWIIAGFLILYIGAAVYLSYSLPALSQSEQSNVIQDTTTEVTVPDVIAK